MSASGEKRRFAEMRLTMGNLLNAVLIIIAIVGSVEEYGALTDKVSTLSDQSQKLSQKIDQERMDAASLVRQETQDRKEDIARVERELQMEVERRNASDAAIVHELDEIRQRLDYLIDHQKDQADNGDPSK